jgi:hypothetical protein
MAGRITRGMTYANVMATLALVVALGGTAAAATVIVKSNSQVAAHTISGHHPPQGDHANLITDSVAGVDLSSGLKTSLTMHCSSGLQTAFDICFDASPRAATDYFGALSTCSLAGLRLPTVGELAEIYDNLAASQADEWTDGFSYDGSQTRAAQLSDDQFRHFVVTSAPLEKLTPYRCVVTPTNY